MTPHSETNVPQERSNLQRYFLHLVTKATEHCSVCVCVCVSICVLGIQLVYWI